MFRSYADISDNHDEVTQITMKMAQGMLYGLLITQKQGFFGYNFLYGGVQKNLRSFNSSVVSGTEVKSFLTKEDEEKSSLAQKLVISKKSSILIQSVLVYMCQGKEL